MHMARTTISNRLLIVDDQAIVREGLKHILDAVTDLWVLDEASNGFEALECWRRPKTEPLLMGVPI
jgi:YesN/AraC family two-component response regulator